ncbi:uncharacterized protein PAF06_013447 [Gastrophryne carolinensis]
MCRQPHADADRARVCGPCAEQALALQSGLPVAAPRFNTPVSPCLNLTPDESHSSVDDQQVVPHKLPTAEQVMSGLAERLGAGKKRSLTPPSYRFSAETEEPAAMQDLDQSEDGELFSGSSSSDELSWSRDGSGPGSWGLCETDELLIKIFEVLFHTATPRLEFLDQDHFQYLISKEWESPCKLAGVPGVWDWKYPFPHDLVERWSAPPEVDAPIIGVVNPPFMAASPSRTLRDVEDRRMDRLASHAFSSVGTALRPVCAAAVTSVAARTLFRKIIDQQMEDLPCEVFNALSDCDVFIRFIL